MHKRIKKRRGELRLTQVEVARRLGVSRQTFLDIESGKTEMRVNRLIPLSQILNVTVDYILKDNFSTSLGFISDRDLLLEIKKRMVS